MLKNFDISVLNDPEYKEDSIREDIVAPILKKLGYSSSGNNKIIRSRALIHPYVTIGSRRNKINIIPDYILEIDNHIQVIIDAKSPHVSLEQSRHAEQAYSYAIHPEVRAKMYSLCNGKEWIIWDIDKFEPILKITIDDLINNFSKIEKILNPKSVLDPNQRNFLSDFGLKALKIGIPQNTIQHFIVPIDGIGKVEDNLYTMDSVIDLDEKESSMVSFDFNNEIYQKFLSLVPEHTKSLITDALSRQPYRIYGIEPIIVTITGKFGVLQHGKYEDFVPIIINHIE